MVEDSFDYNGKCIGSTKDLGRNMVSMNGRKEIRRQCRYLSILRPITHIDNHVSNDFVIGNKFRVLLLCLEEAVKKVILAISKFGILHAFHETLDRETSSNRKVVKLVQRARPLWVLAKPFV